MLAVRTFDGTWNRGNILPRACGNAMCEVKAHHEIEKEREDGHLAFARKIGQSAVSRLVCCAREIKILSCLYSSCVRGASFYRSEYAASQLTQPCAEKYRKEINVGTRR